MANQPDITAPVSRGAAASFGTIMNYGTAVNSTNGGLNGTVGGNANNGVASFNNAASNPPQFIKDGNNGGASKDSLVSSLNPTTIQNDSVNDRISQYVARTAQNLISHESGYHTDFPTATDIAFPGSTKNPSYAIDGNTYPNAPGKVGAGLQAGPVLGATNNLASAQYQVSLALQDSATGIDGKAPIGSPTPQVRNESEEGISSTNFEIRTTNTASANTPAEAPVANGLNGQFTDVQVG